MQRFLCRVAIVAIGIVAAVPFPVHAQGRGAQRDPALLARRDSLEKALEAIAVIDRKLMKIGRASCRERV